MKAPWLLLLAISMLAMCIVPSLEASADPAPPNASCRNVVPVTLPAIVTGTTVGAGRDCTKLDYPHVWEAFTLTECMEVSVSYCGTQPSFSRYATVLLKGCPCDSVVPADHSDFTCADLNPVIRWYYLKPGTYYYPVLYDSSLANGPYTLSISGTPLECRYCEAKSYCGDFFIWNVRIGSLSSGSDCENYGDFTHLSEQVYRGGSTSMLVERNPFANSITTARIGVWADWNHDHDFDDSLEQAAITEPNYDYRFPISLKVPRSALLGPTRLRIRLLYGGLPRPCEVGGSGEVEDYSLDVTDFTCGDATGDGQTTAEDLMLLLEYYFLYGPAPVPVEAADVNGDGSTNIADIAFVVDYLYGDSHEFRCP